MFKLVEVLGGGGVHAAHVPLTFQSDALLQLLFKSDFKNEFSRIYRSVKMVLCENIDKVQIEGGGGGVGDIAFGVLALA